MQTFTLDHTIGHVGQVDTLDIPYQLMVELLGEPASFADDDYPNDMFKTDVHWGLRLADGTEIAIWNYKNGPNYLGCDAILLREVDRFSVWTTDREAARDFLAELRADAAQLRSVKVVATSDDGAGWSVEVIGGEIMLTVGHSDAEVLAPEQATRLAQALLAARNVPA